MHLRGHASFKEAVLRLRTLCFVIVIFQVTDGSAKYDFLLWPNNTVPYSFSSIMRNDTADRKMVLTSMQIISRMTGNCVKFVQRTTEPDYLYITKGAHCLSYTGRTGGKQAFPVQRACLNEYGSIQHELMHTLGFYHENQRPDRDKYIQIIWSNIKPEGFNNFAIRHEMETYGLPYDYYSVTHYNPFNEFAVDKSKPTMIPNVNGTRLGQNENLSSLDVAKIHQRYKCGVAAASYFTGDDTVNENSSLKDTPRTSIALPVALGTLIPIAAAVVVALCCLRLKNHRQGHSTMRKARWRPHSFVKSGALHDLSSVHANLIMNDPALKGHVSLLEISLAKVVISNNLLGKGATGIVWRGTADGVYGHPGKVDVAVKSARKKYDTGQIRQLLQEMKVMTQAGRHLNIVNLLGVVTKVLLLEYAQFGSLLMYLQSYSTEHVYNHVDENGNILPYDEDKAECIEQLLLVNDPCWAEHGLSPPFLSSKALLSFVYQISRGMEYLGTKSIIHRDLAARNVLICDRSVVKISDFGMAQVGTDDTPFDPKEALPVRWMPPEAITSRIFSHKSDVWSFGVTMWETFSLGKIPYGGSDIMRRPISEFVISLRNGLRLERPVFCPIAIYGWMSRCWGCLPDDRPDFAELTQALRLVIDGDSAETYLLLDDVYNQFNMNYLTMLEHATMDGSVSLH
ncbi:fibroblast growth factor receptor 4-like isoform X2 [Paramacrobiotus metropolitanus]|uniref:fibroblast growth factor receptor 4-like isoform X2 n=1 Tax=Paramacrobiotus metropolitanus TaxID=2943436 RepID=UPI002445981A|nr:fibroblast growth factor receptor 4-like isoform X2 [Paramacrobiotus metropolitanus]